MTTTTSYKSSDVVRMFDILTELSEVTRQAEKRKLMQEIVEHPAAQVAEDIFKYALDWRISFGVKPAKIGEYRFNGSASTAHLVHEDFVELCKQLASGELSGNAARSAVKIFLNSCYTVDQQRWYHAVLDKHLRMGVDVLVNEFFPGLIEVYDVPKGAALIKQKTQEIVPSVKKRLSYPLKSEPKLDGYAILTYVNLDQEIAECRTSGGEALVAMQPFADRILARILKVGVRDWLTDEFYVDGEVTATYGSREADAQWSDAWGKAGALAQSLQPRKSGKTPKLSVEMQTMLDCDLTYTTYDIFPASAMIAPVAVFPPKRHMELERLFSRTKLKYIEVIEQVECASWAETQAQHKLWVAAGYEGSIYRMQDTPIWSAGSRCRNNYVKQKDYQRVDAVILNIEEGSGKYEGSGGAFVCWMPERKAVTKSTILGDALRAWVWKHRREILGYWVEITMDASVAGNAHKARNPVARFRHDQRCVTGHELAAMFKAAKIPMPKDFPQMEFKTFHKELASMK